MTDEAREAALDIVDALEAAAADSLGRLTPADAEVAWEAMRRIQLAIGWYGSGVAAEMYKPMTHFAERYGLCPACGHAECTCEPGTMAEDVDIVWAESRGVR